MTTTSKIPLIRVKRIRPGSPMFCPSFSMQEMESPTKNKVGGQPWQSSTDPGNWRTSTATSEFQRRLDIAEVKRQATRKKSYLNHDRKRKRFQPCHIVYDTTASITLQLHAVTALHPAPRHIWMAFRASNSRICGGICRRVLSTTRFTCGKSRGRCGPRWRKGHATGLPNLAESAM